MGRRSSRRSRRRWPRMTGERVAVHARRADRRRRPCAGDGGPCRHRQAADRASAARRAQRAGPAGSRSRCSTSSRWPTTGTRASPASAGAISTGSSTAARRRRWSAARSGMSPSPLDAEAMAEGAAHARRAARLHHLPLGPLPVGQPGQDARPARRSKRVGDEIHIEAAARSFLHHQVRSMVGCLALVGRGQWSPDDIRAALEARDRAALGLNAPPDGLYFVEATLSPRPEHFPRCAAGRGRPAGWR